MDKIYAAIDLKSFYASCECIARELDPLNTNLVVADPTRTDKTICLAVSPSLKALGIPGRPRLFEVVQKVAQVNDLRRCGAPGGQFRGKSVFAQELARDKSLAVDYIVAPPRMRHYMENSARIYETYLDFVAPEDIHVYSIDEVFIDLTPYLRLYGKSPQALVSEMISAVLKNTGITAVAGLGTNLYLCKVAMDILAKHAPPDENGVRVAFLDEQSYREKLWAHTPITDFWRVGPGYARRLEKIGLRTMGDIARCSLGSEEEFHNEQLLYRTFGVNAQLLIDHAWGWEPVTIRDIRLYRPSTNSLSSGQVLSCPYPWAKARLVTREMADSMVLDLVSKGLCTDKLTLTLGYDIENLQNPALDRCYTGAVTTDRYGRKVPKHSHGTQNLPQPSSSTAQIVEAVMELYDRIADLALLVRRITLGAAVYPEQPRQEPQQLTLFDTPVQDRSREKSRQRAVLDIQNRFGKNAILKGMNLREGATARERNGQVGGHKG